MDETFQKLRASPTTSALITACAAIYGVAAMYFNWDLAREDITSIRVMLFLLTIICCYTTYTFLRGKPITFFRVELEDEETEMNIVARCLIFLGTSIVFFVTPWII